MNDNIVLHRPDGAGCRNRAASSPWVQDRRMAQLLAPEHFVSPKSLSQPFNAEAGDLDDFDRYVWESLTAAQGPPDAMSVAGPASDGFAERQALAPQWLPAAQPAPAASPPQAPLPPLPTSSAQQSVLAPCAQPWAMLAENWEPVQAATLPVAAVGAVEAAQQGGGQPKKRGRPLGSKDTKKRRPVGEKQREKEELRRIGAQKKPGRPRKDGRPAGIDLPHNAAQKAVYETHRQRL